MTRRARSRNRYSIAAISMLVWTMLILGLYYAVQAHKPVTRALAEALGGALVDSVVALLFALIGGGLGKRLLRGLNLSTWGAAERLAAEGIIGLAALSLLILGVGVILLNSLSMAALLIVVGALVWRDVVGWIGAFVRWLRGGLPTERWPRFLALVTLIMLILAFILALMPPYKWDVLTYHLAGPQQYVQEGRFYAVAHNHFLGFPQLVDTLYAGQLGLTGRLEGSGLIHWVIGVFLLMGAGGYAARRTTNAAGWVTVTVLLAATTVWLEMTFAYSDLMPMALMVIGLAAAELWCDARAELLEGDHSPTRYLILVGIAAGLGMSTKYTALWMGVALGVLVLVLGWRDGWRKMITYGVVYGIAAAAMMVPWLVRNVVWYHNPVYPLVFEAGEMDSIRQEWYAQPNSGLAYGPDAWQVPVLPITATYLGVEGAGTYATDIGPLFLMLAPLVLLAWVQFSDDERKTIRRALVIVGVVTAIWMFTAAFGSHVSLRTRFVLYMFGPLAIVIGIALEAARRLPKKPFDLSFILQALVALTLVFMVIGGITFFNKNGVNLYFSGDDTYKGDYLKHELGWHYVTMQDISQLPRESTVRFLWEPRYLYCDNERLHCYTDSLMDAWYYARRTVGDGSPAAIADRWKADGADYLLVYELGRKFECGKFCGSDEEGTDLYSTDDWRAWDAFVADYLVEVWHNGPEDETRYILYRWRE
jgi:4-amino-4-deoxy-L-arabinose transferase-like glycosyltransferase